MLIYVDLGSLLGGRFSSKMELVFDEFSSSVFMLIYDDVGSSFWRLFAPRKQKHRERAIFEFFIITPPMYKPWF